MTIKQSEDAINKIIKKYGKNWREVESLPLEKFNSCVNELKSISYSPLGSGTFIRIEA